MLDALYILGLLIVWAGNLTQIARMIITKSTKSLSFIWLWAIFLSIGVRLPRAILSTYWVWQIGYMISFAISLALVVVAIYYRRKYGRI